MDPKSVHIPFSHWYQALGQCIKLSLNSSPKTIGEASPSASSRSVSLKDLLPSSVKENQTVHPGRKQRAVILTSSNNIENVKRKVQQEVPKITKSQCGLIPLRTTQVWKR
jgi:hypothetical protein